MWQPALPPLVFRLACRFRCPTRSASLSNLDGVCGVLLKSVLTCPFCQHRAAELMPENAYNCKRCGRRLKPRAGDCCVFCSYGSVPCPPIQDSGGDACCNSG
ncbi:MAG: GDCCVxC domain-containing (seleno)protein [Bradyrhizobium sp.]